MPQVETTFIEDVLPGDCIEWYCDVWSVVISVEAYVKNEIEHRRISLLHCEGDVESHNISGHVTYGKLT